MRFTYADYRGNRYVFIQDMLITNDESTAIDGFVKDGEYYVKHLDDFSEVHGVTKLEFFAIYDTGIDNVTTEWLLSNKEDAIINNRLHLYFCGRLLDDWLVEDDNICSNYVSIEDIDKIYMTTIRIIHGKISANTTENFPWISGDMIVPSNLVNTSVLTNGRTEEDIETTYEIRSFEMDKFRYLAIFNNYKALSEYFGIKENM